MMIYYPLPFPNSDLYHLYHYGEYHENLILSPWFRTFVLFTPPFFGGLQRRLPSPQRDFAVAQGQTRRTHLVWGLGTTRRRGSAGHGFPIVWNHGFLGNDPKMAASFRWVNYDNLPRWFNGNASGVLVNHDWPWVYEEIMWRW